MAKVKFRHSTNGYVELMRSPAVSSEIESRANRIASAADAMVGRDPSMRNENFYVHANGGGDRIGAVIVAGNTHSIRHNAKYNTLLKALNAGRE